MSDNTAPLLVGRPGDGWWVWAPLPLLFLAAWAVAQLGDIPRHVALQGLFLLNFLHLGATWTRLYGDARREHPLAAYLLPALLLAMCMYMLSVGREGTLILLVFLTNIPHIGLQNHGFLAVAARREGCSDPLDRWLDRTYQLAVPLLLAVWFAAQPGADLFRSRELGLDRIPAAVWATSATAVGALFLGVWARMIWLWRSGAPVPSERWALHAAYGPGMALCLFALPPELAAVPVAGTHYLQYLVIVRRYHRRAVDIEGRQSLWARAPWPAYLALLALLAPGIPVVVDTALEPLLGALIPAIGSAASLHHFLADGLIWRLAEPRVAKVMVG